MSNQFSSLSRELTKKLLLEEKKNNGIYFTPQDIIKLCVDNIVPFTHTISSVLEPSCGSCEFISYLDKIYENISICGIEYNKIIYNEIKNITSTKNKLSIVNGNYLTQNEDNQLVFLTNLPDLP